MKQKENVNTIDSSSIDGKRGRGRPAKVDALTPAERARRYREKQKAMLGVDKGTGDNNTVTKKKMVDIQGKLLKLQMKYDLEHLAVIQLQTELAGLKQAIKKPTVNPLARQVAALKKTVAEQERTISAYSAEINHLRDALRLSQKNGK